MRDDHQSGRGTTAISAPLIAAAPVVPAPSTNRRGTSVRALVVAGLLAVVLLYLAFRGVAWPEVLRHVRTARPELLGLVFLTFTGSYLCRGLRWSVLLRAAGPLPIPTVFWATTVGYLGNSFLPARAGELIRSAMLARATGVDVGFVLATALTERVLDAAALVVIGLAALTAVPDLPPLMVSTTRVMAGAGLVGLTGLLLAPRLEWLVVAILSRAPLGRYRAKVLDMAVRFLLGLRAIQDPGRAVRFVALTAVIWTLDAVATVLVGRALDLPLTMMHAFLLIAALGLASAAPSTPGFVGIYQFVAVSLLVPFGFDQNQVVAFILTFQVVTYAVVLVWGLPGLWRLTALQPKHPIPGPTSAG